MRTILIFDDIISGHHLEYIHHIHEYIATQMPEMRAIFVVPFDFLENKERLDWSSCDNIEYRYLSAEDIDKCSTSSAMKKALLRTKLLRKYAKRERADTIVLITLMAFMPFVSILMPRRVKVRGIIYNIYLYDWKKYSIFRKIQDWLKYVLLTRSKVIDKIFILNDNSACCYLNKLYNTTKCTYIPDPINIETKEPRNIRKDLGISQDSKMYIHFGGLTARKGTMDIVETIIKMSEDEAKNKSFVFAGKVYNDIRERFYSRIEIARSKTSVLVFDEFCSYEFLNNLCYSCDVILAPYKNTSFSSGIVGYGAVFRKPVVGTKGGLLGKLIERNKLGVVSASLDANTLAYASEDLIAAKVSSNTYVEKHSLSMFQSAIFE